MIPLKLTLSGIMSYREEQTLDFKDDSLWVLVGKNASGKSSIFDAIIFVLFGETRIKGVPNRELVNHYSDTAQITFDFAVGNQQYRVKRTINKKGSVTRQASILLLKPDGSLVPQPIPLTHKEKEFKNWIENDIGLNYEVFITSVLLRQGKADAFLDAPTETRYDVLSKLIDLSKYAALEGRAREQKKFWEVQASFYRENLRRLSPVTEKDLNDAKAAIRRESGVVKATQILEKKLQTLFGQASQWELLNTDLLTTRKKITNNQSLLARAGEINNCYQRLIDLRRVLPRLKVSLDLTVAIQLDEAEVQRLSSEWSTNDDLIRTRELNIGALDADYQQKVSQAEEISEESTRVYRRRSELSLVVSLIAQVERLETTLEDHRIALTKYPDNLDNLLQDSETERNRLLEAQQTIPGLSRLTNERTKLADAEKRRLRLTKELQDKKTPRPSLMQAYEDAQRDIEIAEAHAKSLRDALTEANTLLDSTRKHMENFNQVAGAAKCQYCGSDLTEDHKTRERERLTSEFETKHSLAKKAKRDYARAEKALEQAKAFRSSTADSLAQLDTEIASMVQDIKGCERDIREQLAAIDMTYDALPAAFQVRVCSSKPVSTNQWIETIYPRSSDLKELKGAVKVFLQRQEDISKLVKQVGERNRMRILWTDTSDMLNATKESLPADWENLQAEHKRLSEAEGQIKEQLEAVQKKQREAINALEKAKTELRRIYDSQARRAGTLETIKITLDRNHSNLTAQIAQLPENWRTKAETMTEEKLGMFAAELDELLEYEELHQQLTSASKTLTDLCAHHEEIQETIDTLPAEARRPAEQVEKELIDARKTSREAESRREQARTRHAQMLLQRDQYKEEEENMKAAARKAHLYGILSNQFGEKGIQKAIINKAEIAIVRLSNQMLDNLSGGRSKLQLREAGGNKKALDLEVWDSQTGGDKPILAGLASGSQRFRIAISLALGIGQYIGNESNRIESVIIDEGFGSLDREGRESIIQELHNLSRHLKRIILVSHQEEFSRGFSTGYEVQLVDGASQVKPLTQ